MRCRHVHRSWRYWEVAEHDWQPLFQVCDDCGEEWIAIGPANDGGEHAAQVAVEVRGTALADNWREQSYRPGCDRLEWCPETKSDELCDLCQAHVLAHAIATHEASDE